MNRRTFSLQMAGAVLTGVFTEAANAQVKPFVIRIVRTAGWDQLMMREKCIPGTVYSVLPDRIESDNPGTRICYSMELPKRGNAGDLSAIKAGRYPAKGRLSDKTGPVLEMSKVEGRTAVQLHTGNTVGNTEGCILLGTAPVSHRALSGAGVLSAGECWIGGSREARKALLDLYGWTNLGESPPPRPAVVIIEG